MTTIVNDNFNRANANPIGGIYSTLAGRNAIQVSSDTAVGTVVNSSSGVFDSTNSYANDQYASITLALTISFLTSSVIVRCTNSSTTQAEFTVGNNSTASALIIRVSGTPTTVATPTLNTVPTTGDTYTLVVAGQLYSMYQNGALVGQYSDGSSSLISGTTGFYLTSETPVTGGNSIALFQAGNGSPFSTITPPGQILT
jgi:hypothetical protein